LGTNWIAEAPVPTTATRRQLRSWSWFHLAEWNQVPGKVSRPGSGGIEGSLNAPAADISTRARYLRLLVSISHRCLASFHAAVRTSSLRRIRDRMPNSSAQRWR
jgi:hypothetical protein